MEFQNFECISCIGRDTCIDCEVCQEACPVNAIWPEDELPDEYSEWLEKNRDLFAAGVNITQQKDPLPDARDLGAVQEEEREKGWDILEPSNA